MPRVPRAVALVMIVGVVLVAGACGSGGGRPGSGNGSGDGPGSGSGVAAAGSYAVTVHVGATLVRFDPARLAGLPRVDVATPESGGETTQSGPTLASVLAAAGVGGYRGVRVVGPSESVTLPAAQVGPDLLLASTRRGTVKLAGPGLDPARWVRDVTDVEVTT